MNIFKGLQNSPLFIAILLFTLFSQYFIIEYGGDFVRTTSLTHEQWIKCILLASLTLPLGIYIYIIYINAFLYVYIYMLSFMYIDIYVCI